MHLETIIGLEVHVQLNTKTKLFCACQTSFGAPANTNVCPVCLGHPGSLPVVNESAVYKALLAGLALNSTVNLFSRFDRKSYFYPDLPKGYQISQQAYPLCSDGHLKVEVKDDTKTSYQKHVRIKRLHLEEDAGKLLHSENRALLESYVDLNRAGTALIEVVSQPDINSSSEAVAYLEALKAIMLYLEVSDCNMEEGSLRCDVNVSLRRQNSAEFGNRCEIKNMNSFRGIKEAIDFEIHRQRVLLEEGKVIEVNTLLWDAEKQETRVMRSKESVHDYRYFPDPDLMPCIHSQAEIDRLRRSLVELPSAKGERFRRDYKLSEYDSDILVSDKHLADYYEAAVKICPDQPKKICNWITTEILSILNEELLSIKDFSVPPENIGLLIRLITQGKLSGKLAKDIFPEMIQTNKSPEVLIEEKDLKVVSDESTLKSIGRKIIQDSPEIVQKYRSGNQKTFGYLVGQAIKQSKGQANPSLMSKVLRELLDENND